MRNETLVPGKAVFVNEILVEKRPVCKSILTVPAQNALLAGNRSDRMNVQTVFFDDHGQKRVGQCAGKLGRVVECDNLLAVVLLLKVILAVLNMGRSLIIPKKFFLLPAILPQVILMLKNWRVHLK